VKPLLLFESSKDIRLSSNRSQKSISYYGSSVTGIPVPVPVSLMLETSNNSPDFLTVFTVAFPLIYIGLNHTLTSSPNSIPFHLKLLSSFFM